MRNKKERVFENVEIKGMNIKNVKMEATTLAKCRSIRVYPERLKRASSIGDFTVILIRHQNINSLLDRHCSGLVT